MDEKRVDPAHAVPGVDEWPYPYVSDLYYAGVSTWHEINERTFYQLLEVLPPAAIKHDKSGHPVTCWGFAVGEPLTHAELGPVHSVCVQLGDRFYISETPLVSFNIEAYRLEIVHQINNVSK